MFTGLITDVGVVRSHVGERFAIRSSYPVGGLALGISIACDGVCLTVTGFEPDEGEGSIFTVDVSNETRSKTTLGEWHPGRAVNLERSLTAGTEMGGHIVSGHVDGVARIVAAHRDGESQRISIEAPEHLASYIAPKGSVALDGVSLTVNEVSGNRFGINLIPHTLTVTTWGRKKPGDLVNLEVDIIARYVARLMEFRP